MEIFKDLVRFNRYKSVESFNNATDINIEYNIYC